MIQNREFHPERISRQAEWVAWAMAGIVLVFLGIAIARCDEVSWASLLFAGFLTLLAGSLSLSNWMVRNTTLKLTPEGVEFRNGLRAIRMHWDTIQEVRVFLTRFGKVIEVVGPPGTFTFRDLTEVETGGKHPSRMGFVQGNFILQQILSAAGLHLVREDQNGRYYARP